VSVVATKGGIVKDSGLAMVELQGDDVTAYGAWKRCRWEYLIPIMFCVRGRRRMQSRAEGMMSGLEYGRGKNKKERKYEHI
jgi:hypothetical protein